ncbi:MAG: DNA cytosine methyltransferase [Sarcina sp.]
MTYKTIDLFCGAGGFSLGFEDKGFETVLAIDKWKDAIETFNENRKKKVGINIDIHEFTNEKLSDLKSNFEIDGIIGGPPCQGFSMVGSRDEQDQRNSLYLEYVRFVKIIKPKFFVLENVKGLLTLMNGFYKEDIIQRFSQFGYNVNYKILKASHFGVPQSRERVFFVGLRKDIFEGEFFEFPNENIENVVTTKEALSDLPRLDKGDDNTKYKYKAMNEYQQRMRKKCRKLKNNELTMHTEQTKKIISMVPDGGSIRDLPSEYYSIRNYNSAFKRMNSNLPSTTIDCGHRNYFHYKENRVPTVRESARIQSFPDRYIFSGSKTSQYTQVGNAVPPILGEVIAEQIYEILERIKINLIKK